MYITGPIFITFLVRFESKFWINSDKVSVQKSNIVNKKKLRKFEM